MLTQNHHFLKGHMIESSRIAIYDFILVKIRPMLRVSIIELFKSIFMVFWLRGEQRCSEAAICQKL